MAAPQTDPQYKLRMPDSLRDRLREAATANGRSMNSEIVQRLEASFSGTLIDRSTLTEEQLRHVSKLEKALTELIGSAGMIFSAGRAGRENNNEGAR